MGSDIARNARVSKKKSASTAVPTHPASVAICPSQAAVSARRAVGGGRSGDVGVPCPKPHTGRSCLGAGGGRDRLLLNSYMPLQAVVADVVATTRCRTQSFDADLGKMTSRGEPCAWTTGCRLSRCHGGEGCEPGWRLSMGPRVP